MKILLKTFWSENFKIVINDDNIKKYKSLCAYLLKLKNNNKIEDNDYKYIYPKTYRTPVAYFLPKTHKSDFKENLKVRPIISSYNSYCYNLAKYLSNELAKELKFENPTTDNFLKKFRKIIYDKNSFMLSLDI